MRDDKGVRVNLSARVVDLCDSEPGFSGDLPIPPDSSSTTEFSGVKLDLEGRGYSTCIDSSKAINIYHILFIALGCFIFKIYQLSLPNVKGHRSPMSQIDRESYYIDILQSRS